MNDNQHERKQFFDLIADVYAFYRQDFSKFAGAVWWEAMKPFDLDAVRHALNQHCVNPDVGQFPPKPADVVRTLQGRTQDQAAVAWAKVDKAVRMVGTYRDVVFDDPIIHRVVVDMGGWIWLGKQTDDEWPFVARNFETRYRGYRLQGSIPEYQPVLIGIANAQNQLQGYGTEAPTLIGDARAAETVMRLGSPKPVLEITQMKPDAASRALRLINQQAGNDRPTSH